MCACVYKHTRVCTHICELKLEKDTTLGISEVHLLMGLLDNVTWQKICQSWLLLKFVN